jgi:uncharacterized protein (TIGR01370 family)
MLTRKSGLAVWLGLAWLSLALAASATAGASTATPTVWYVRPDGGSPSQCTGQVDAPYSGDGPAQPCAWDHPFRALPPGGAPRIDGGDMLIIGPGSYKMGYGAPGAGQCEPAYPWDCYMVPPPSGPDPEHPTQIRGVGWDDGCMAPPELWGTERALRIINLASVSNVEVGCLEITDHSSCVEFHPSSGACDRGTFPFGDWAATGLYAADAGNIRLHDLDIHGLAHTGVQAARIANWQIENVRIAGNGWVGWDGDIDGDDANSGTLQFRHWKVEWNGCGETWPGEEPTGCWGQTAGGYGDGVGTGVTGGLWIIEDSSFLNNTSDGLDLLYAREPDSRIEIRRTTAAGNAGNQIKTTGDTRLENAIIIGNCGFFDGRAFTYDVDNCRALGAALSLNLGRSDQARVVNSTVASEGDCLVTAECEGGCDGTETVWMRNNVFQGATDFLQPWQRTCLVYEETFPADPFDVDYSVIAQVKGDLCPGPHDVCATSTGVRNPAIDAFDARLTPHSPAIDAGLETAGPDHDFQGRPRRRRPDIGAYEYGPCPPDTDITGDGFTNSKDLRFVVDMWRTPLPASYADPNGDGATDVSDIGFVAAGMGDACAGAGPPMELAHVDDFLYQLQDLDLAAASATRYDLVVMDYAADGSESTEFPASDIHELKHSSGGEKIVLAYMSIGEAEDYRFYWQSDWIPGDPLWLGAVNPDWPRNYKVHFWDAAWQAIIVEYLNRVIDAGFDGVYLDLVDAYEYYLDRGRSTAAGEMGDFVTAISAHAHRRDPDFILLAQNGAALATLVPGYLDAVHGVGQEDMFYGYNADDVMTPPDVTSEMEGALDAFVQAGKVVFTVDYATTPAHVDDAYAKSLTRGYVPFVTVRDLDQLVINPGHEPD